MPEHIKSYIDLRRKDMVAMLEDMVNMDSATENIAGANRLGDYVAERFAQEGFSIERESKTECGSPVVCRLRGDKDITLMLGHLDTALPQGTAEKSPFRVEGNRAYGPGVYDMKAGVVAALYAIKAVQAAGVRPNLTLIWNCDEETGSRYSRAAISREAMNAARCLVMETAQSHGGITTSRKGVGVFKLCCTGVPSHAGADPLRGRSAVVDMCHKILEFNALNDYPRGISVNAGVIEGGTTPSIIAEHARLELDVRIPDLASGEHIREAIKAIAAKEHVQGVSCTLEGDFHRWPMERSPESAALFDMLQTTGREMGLELHEESSGGASDANITSAIGLPTLCGVGPEGDGAHTPDEYLDLPTLFSRTEMLARLLMKLYGDEEIHESRA